MKADLAILIGLCAFLSCKNSQEVFKGSENIAVIKLNEGEWVSNFKNEVFIRCLKKLYPTNFSEVIEAMDASTAANLEWLNFNQDVIRKADSLVSSFTKRENLSWTIENKKVIMNFCIAYRNSKELDKLTMKIYRQFLSSEKDQ